MVTTHDISVKYPAYFSYWLVFKNKTITVLPVVIPSLLFMGNKVYFSVPISRAYILLRYFFSFKVSMQQARPLTSKWH